MRTFEVNTHNAYLNTEIVLSSNAGACEVIDATTKTTYSFDSVLKIKLCAGKHTLYCQNSGQTEEVLIEDAIKLGGSEIKYEAGFISETTPWAVVTMKDRIYFYNRDTKSEFVEYNLSPVSVKYIGGKNKEYFLFGTNNDYSVFDAQTRQIAYSCKHVVYSNGHLVISQENEVLTIYDYIDDMIVLQCDGQYSIYDSYLFYANENNICRLDLESNEITFLKSKLRTSTYQLSGKYALVYVANYGRKVYYKLINLLMDTLSTMYMDYYIASIGGVKLSIAQKIEDQFDKLITNNDSLLQDYYISISMSVYNILNFKIVDGKDIMEVELVSKYKQNARWNTSRIYLIFEISGHVDYEYAIKVNAPQLKQVEKQNPFKIDGDKGRLVCYSESRNLYISLKDGKLYETNTSDNSCTRILEDIFNYKRYLNAYYTSDGNSVVAINSDKTADILGFEDLTEERFDTTNSTVAFTNNYGVNGYKPELNIIFGDSRKPIWRDPITLEVISDDNRSKCIFRSPDGKLSADNNMKETYLNSLTDSEITNEEYCELCTLYDWGYNVTDEEKIKKQKLREDLGHKYSDRKEITDCNADKYTDKFINKLYYVHYRKVGDTTDNRILIGQNVWFLNYVSFSHDSCYLALGAKFINGSGVFVLYDLANKRVVADTISHDCRSIYAVWMAMFSRNGVAAYYDSVPNTYLRSKENEYSAVVKIEYRSLLCFSPSGKYVALSSQGYTAYNHGKNCNWGHQPSGAIYVHATNNPKVEIEHYNDLGKGINGISSSAGNVASAAFSIDEKRFLAVGTDGVIVIRNLKCV